MIAAIMQPYFFPYIGYFQLMRAVDQFVFYDDVQYSTGGWVNRNRVAIGNAAKWMTLPVAHASLGLDIRQRQYRLEAGSIDAVKRKLEAAYSRAPAFEEVFPVISRSLEFSESSVSAFNAQILRALAIKLGLECRFSNSSDLAMDADLRGQERVIAICSQLRATRYINASGGQDLYHSRNFTTKGIDLAFLRSATPPFAIGEGVQYLSIVHHLMKLGFDGTRALMDDFELLAPLH